MRFYLGTHQPAWLARGLEAPLLVSHRRLAGRRSLPRATGRWALDSGGFTELSLHGRWRTTATEYVAAVRRYVDEIGHLDWAAPRDWMTEDTVRARTGLTLRTHLVRTVTDYLDLRHRAPDLPFIPVIQGQTIDDYLHCADLYEHHGIDLTAHPVVGVGSVCRRQHTTEVDTIARTLAARGYRLHLFGAKILGLTRYADTITSSDSMAWSYAGRYRPGCTPTHRTESNCLPWALTWYRHVLTTTTPSRTSPRRPPTRNDTNRPTTPRSPRRDQRKHPRTSTTHPPGHYR
ncbi:deazapurine DNA modification protein DpdA family protein [Actinokineospora bangkokensis]|uniref:deazapurine DNA modification protein DpdA family protein n=1 Tax=Actinokineospora bangkokensis TaxID=1193682 RepID=UPI000AF84E60|nr:hypothetical protein [Actinokineospora bangkokensis]